MWKKKVPEGFNFDQCCELVKESSLRYPFLKKDEFSL